MTPDPRHFLDWDAPALPAAATLMADAYAVGDTMDLAGAVIVLPGARAGRRLKELLVAEAARRRLRLVPPQVVTVGALPELLYAPDAPIADGELCRRLWLRQLRVLPESRREVLFPRSPGADDLRGWFALADVVAGLHRSVAAAGRRFGDVARECRELFDDSERWTVLGELQQAVAEELEGRGLQDRELARMDAAAAGRIACAADLWLVGVAEMPVLVRTMLQRVPRERLRVLVHAPADEAGAFDELGCVRPQHWLRREIEIDDERLAIVGHPSAQAREAAAAVARLAGAYAADEIVIGVPDVEVVPTLEREFASAGVATRYMAGEGDERRPDFRLLTAGVPARYAAGVPIERTSPFRLLEAIADVLRDHSYEAAAALARHPAFGEWLTRRRWQVEHSGAAAFRDSDGWLAQLDTFLCERTPYTLTGEMGGAGGRGRAVAEALRTALLGDGMLGGLEGVRPLREWMPRLLALVLEIYGERALHRHVRDEQRLLAFAQKLRDVAHAFEGVPPELDEVCDAATAIHLLLDGVSGDALPPDADDVAIELLGWLELHLDDAPVAILTGMNEPFVPEAVNADAFLPNALRSRLGMEDNERRYARDAYQLTAMLQSRHVHVVAGRRTLLGDPLRPSRLLLATSGTALARRVRAYLGDPAAGAPAEVVPGAVTDGAPPATESRFALPPERVISLPEVPTSLSVTEFGSVLSDPYGWALGRAIAGDVVDDAQRELDPMRFGTLAHRVLEMFGRTPAAASDDVNVVAAALDACLDEYVAQNYGAVFPAVRLQVEQLRLRLRTFAAVQARRVADGWRTVAVEYGTPEGGVPLPFDAGFRVRGRIDRIDYHAATGAWALLDYKTGERGDDPEKKHRNRDGWIDLQLPLYRHILPHVVDDDGNRAFTGGADADVRLGYILLCGNPDEIRFAEVQWTQQELAAAMDAARDVVDTVRRNVFEFPGLDSGWYADDMAELLGRGRLVLEDDDVAEEVAS
ncbi:MAG TPA: PD-(D/E)XK nuclease family protein [Longimicrobiales bacterium]|nr:PD-(D/E)XK nuclease family protein [Longimicrobiales bacterium]